MMRNDKNHPAGAVIFQRSAQVLFWLFVWIMTGSFIRWMQTGDAIYFRSMGVLLFTAAAAANLLATFADRRGIAPRPRWAASVPLYFTLTFFIGLMMIIFVLALARVDGQGATLTLSIGSALALLRYRAYWRRVQSGRIQ